MSALERLEQGLAAGQWVPLSPEADAAPIAQLPPGPGVLVRSGGSSGVSVLVILSASVEGSVRVGARVLEWVRVRAGMRVE